MGKQGILKNQDYLGNQFPKLQIIELNEEIDECAVNRFSLSQIRLKKRMTLVKKKAMSIDTNQIPQPFFLSKLLLYNFYAIHLVNLRKSENNQEFVPPISNKLSKEIRTIKSSITQYRTLTYKVIIVFNSFPTPQTSIIIQSYHRTAKCIIVC